MYKTVKGLERGLDILWLISQRKSVSIRTIAEATHLPRPTVYRLAGTLIERGFVSKEGDKLKVTERALGLASGYTKDDELEEVAVPEMLRLGKSIKWPVQLSTCVGDSMMVLATTIASSPFGYRRLTKGYQAPLESASGHAYLAFVSEHERSGLVHVARGSSRFPENARLRDVSVQSVLEIRRMGYATKRWASVGETHFSTPIMLGDERVAGTLTFYCSDVVARDEEPLGRLVDELLATAAAISRTLSLHSEKEGHCDSSSEFASASV